MQGVSLLEGLEDVDITLELLDLGSLQSVVEFAKRFKASNTKVGFEKDPGSTLDGIQLKALPPRIPCGVFLSVNCVKTF